MYFKENGLSIDMSPVLSLLRPILYWLKGTIHNGFPSGKYDNFRQGCESVINTTSQNSSKITNISSYICIFVYPKMKLFEGYYPNLYGKVSH